MASPSTEEETWIHWKVQAGQDLRSHLVLNPPPEKYPHTFIDEARVQKRDNA